MARRIEEERVGHQAREREHFDRLADLTGEAWWGCVTPAGIQRMERRAQLALQSLRRAAEPLVLELGCGTGAFAKYLLAASPSLRLVGCDISPRAIAVATARYAAYSAARFEIADATAMPYPPATFDAVIGNSVLHHLPIERCLRECWRVLKPGGCLWFSEPNMMNPQVALERNVRFIGKLMQNSEDETAFFRWPLAQVLRRVGFQEISVTPVDFLHPIVPKPLIGLVDRVGRWIEQVPGLREFSGSLFVSAEKGAEPQEAIVAQPAWEKTA